MKEREKEADYRARKTRHHVGSPSGKEIASKSVSF